MKSSDYITLIVLLHSLLMHRFSCSSSNFNYFITNNTDWDIHASFLNGNKLIFFNCAIYICCVCDDSDSASNTALQHYFVPSYSLYSVRGFSFKLKTNWKTYFKFFTIINLFFKVVWLNGGCSKPIFCLKANKSRPPTAALLNLKFRLCMSTCIASKKQM